MDDEQFTAVMNGTPTFEELDAMVADRKRRSEEENRIRAEHIRQRHFKQCADDLDGDDGDHEYHRSVKDRLLFLGSQ